MIGFQPYISFHGNCEEALHFYKKCFGGEIIFVQYYRDSPDGSMSELFKDKVMHSEFKSGPIHFMACDVSADNKGRKINAVTFILAFGDPQEQQIIFNALADGGEIQLLLEETFWETISGMVTDRYGVQWILNCERISVPNK